MINPRCVTPSILQPFSSQFPALENAPFPPPSHTRGPAQGKCPRAGAGAGARGTARAGSGPFRGDLPADGGGAVGSHCPIGLTPKPGHRSGCRRALCRAGVVASTMVLVMQLPGQQPRSAVLASAANPWPGVGSLVGKLRHGLGGKPLGGWGEQGWDIGTADPAVCCSGALLLWVTPLGAAGAMGQRVVPRGCGCLRAADASVTARVWLLWSRPKAAGRMDGATGAVLGARAKPPPRGTTRAGQGEAGRRRWQPSPTPATEAAQGARAERGGSCPGSHGSPGAENTSGAGGGCHSAGPGATAGGVHSPAPRCAGTGPWHGAVGVACGGGAGTKGS